jgi:hypothetical protein
MKLAAVLLVLFALALPSQAARKHRKRRKEPPKKAAPRDPARQREKEKTAMA